MNKASSEVKTERRGGLRSNPGGRPRKPVDEVRVTVAISLLPADRDLLKEEAERLSMSVSQVVSDMIQRRRNSRKSVK